MTLAPVVRDDFSIPFFEAAAAGKLLLRYSPSADAWSEPAALVCSVSQAQDLEWRESSGNATLVTWTIKTARPKDGIAPPPTLIGIVELEEGPWLTLQLRDLQAQELHPGLALLVGFEQPEGSECLPVARPAGDTRPKENAS